MNCEKSSNRKQYRFSELKTFMKHLYDAIIPVLIQLQASLIAIGQYRCEMFVLNIELIFLLVCFT